MSNPHGITVFEAAKSLLEDILCCLVVAFMLYFFHAMATANVYASYYCFVSLTLTLLIGGTCVHLILVANNSSWDIVFDVISLVYLIGSIVQDVRSTLKACKQIIIGEKLGYKPSEELQCKTEAYLKEQEEILSKWEDILNKREYMFSKREETFSKREDNLSKWKDKLSKWEELLTKQEGNLRKEEERVAKAERPDLEGLESQQTAEEMS
ncbi:hypothetical protein KCV07_g5674, partial [Aureobasidium melanogenum]